MCPQKYTPQRLWPDIVRRYAGPLAMLAATVMMLRWSWGTWPDVLVDFGRQLYIPWQLASGKTLYRDIVPHFIGPLSSYFNALWFCLFGVSVRTLVLANLLILTGILWLLYRLLTEISDRFAATTACLVFVTLFAFGQLVEIGNYNFVCPYSHDLTHGIALSLAALYGLSRYLRHRRLVAMAASGGALGLTFLTKPEVFAAAAVALSVGVGLALWTERAAIRRVGHVVGTFLGAVVAPPLVAWSLLCLALPPDHALRGVMNPWLAVFNNQLVFSPFYRWCTGTSDVGASVRQMIVWTAWYAALFVPVTLLARWLRRPGPQRRWSAVLLFVVLQGWLPALVAKRGGYGWLVRAAALAVVLVAISAQLQTVGFYFAQKMHRVGRGADAFRAGQRGASIARAVDVIERRLDLDDTLLVLPEGLMLNQLARRSNPLPQVDFLPPELIIFGEQPILASLAAHPPDYVALVHRSTSEFGYRYFGRDYGQRIYAWVQAHYREVQLIGARPLQDARFGILLLQRIEIRGTRDLIRNGAPRP